MGDRRKQPIAFSRASEKRDASTARRSASVGRGSPSRSGIIPVRAESVVQSGLSRVAPSSSVPMCGEVHMMTITAYDHWGNRRHCGGDSFEVALAHCGNMAPGVTSGGDSSAIKRNSKSSYVTDGTCTTYFKDNGDG